MHNTFHVPIVIYFWSKRKSYIDAMNVLSGLSHTSQVDLLFIVKTKHCGTYLAKLVAENKSTCRNYVIQFWSSPPPPTHTKLIGRRTESHRTKSHKTPRTNSHNLYFLPWQTKSHILSNRSQFKQSFNKRK